MKYFPPTFEPLFKKSQPAQVLKDNQLGLYHYFRMWLKWKHVQPRIIKENHRETIEHMRQEIRYYQSMISHIFERIEFWCKEAIEYDMGMMAP